MQWPIANKPDTGQTNLIKLTNWAKAERGDCLDKNVMYIFNMYTFNNLHQCMCGLNIRTVGETGVGLEQGSFHVYNWILSQKYEFLPS